MSSCNATASYWSAAACCAASCRTARPTCGDGVADNPSDFSVSHFGTTLDGKIVALGTTRTLRFGMGPYGDPDAFTYYTDDTTVVRFNADGTLDATFANQGKSDFDSEDDDAPYPADPRQVIVTPDGAVFGSILGVNTYWRINPAGEMDANFGGDGIVELNDIEPFVAYADAIAIQSDGKLLVAGTHSQNESTFRPANFDQVVRRLNTDGTVDSTFAGGKAIVEFGRTLERATRVLLAPDGTIVVAGSATNDSRDPRLALARLWRDNGPVAQAVAPAVLTPQTTPYRFRVNWRDDEAVDLSSIDNGDLKAIGPDGSVRKAYVVGADATNDSPSFVMNFKVAAPGGAWDAADNGTWTIRVLSNHVADIGGNVMRGRTLATFQVNIPPAQRAASSSGATRPQAASVEPKDEDDGDDDGEPVIV